MNTFEYLTEAGAAPIRVAGSADKPLFVAIDVCGILGLSNPSMALQGLDADEKITLNNPEGNPRDGVPHALACVTESGLYHLVFKSRKPAAQAFRRWVTEEVLPAIRKNGSFSVVAGAVEDDLLTIHEFSREIGGDTLKAVHLVQLGRRASEAMECMHYRPAKHTGWLKLPRSIWTAAFGLWFVRDTGRGGRFAEPEIPAGKIAAIGG